VASAGIARTLELMLTHPQITLPGSGYDVDQGMATLIEWFFDSGVVTLASCQGGPYEGWWEADNKWFAPGVAQSYVLFASLDDTARAFTDICGLAAQCHRPDLLQRVAGRPWLSKISGPGADWEWVVTPLTDVNAPWPECGDIVPAAAVYFDVVDLELVTGLLEA